jgi:lipid-A-disaccharide synthase
MKKKIFFICGESSGDTHGADLLAELYKIFPKEMLTIKAIGGDHLREQGAEILYDCKHLGSMGLTEVIDKLSRYVNLEKDILLQISTFSPHVVILVDFPGFNLRLCSKIKKYSPNTKIVYYFPPQVWAWNQGRTKILAKHCDLVLCGFPFEEKFHRDRGVNAFYVGNPLLNELEKYDKEKLKEDFGIKKEEVLIGIFPGSRKSEIHFMFELLLKAADTLSKEFPKCRFIVSQARTIDSLNENEHWKKYSKSIGENKIRILPAENKNNHKLLAASDYLWLTSGTVTLEAALYENPLILGYRGNSINYILYLIFKRINMIGLPNIISGKVIVPELIQNQTTAENYYATTKQWLMNSHTLKETRENLKKLKDILGSKNASLEAATKVKELLN